MEKTLEPLLYYWNATRRSEEGFGDFCARIGFPGLEAYAASFISPATSSSLPQARARHLPRPASARRLLACHPGGI